jgi:hypothetical protein
MGGDVIEIRRENNSSIHLVQVVCNECTCIVCRMYEAPIAEIGYRFIGALKARKVFSLPYCTY